MKAYYKGKRAHLRLTCVVQKSFRLTSLMLFNWGYVQTIRDGMNSNGPELEQVVHTHRISSWSAWPKGFGKLNPRLHSWINPEHLLLSLLLAPNNSLPLDPTKVWHRIYPICDTLLLEIGTAQLRSFTEIAPPQPFLRVNHSPIRYGFRAGKKVHPVYREHSLSR